ncbi:hypothetical protein [Actinoalloteichus spitiensis]|uniref:hypothetical protein n=1 Tax=Actinoalloteichus spitiensis TaxID=252394 RepID=UPI00036D2B0F|nr:hypothetical protein [Actinoalloteichus spitiensis]
MTTESTLGDFREGLEAAWYPVFRERHSLHPQLYNLLEQKMSECVQIIAEAEFRGRYPNPRS